MAREGKAPAFQFYAADWLADMWVATLSLAQKGAYLDLLCYQWREGHLPADEARLSTLLKVPRREFGRIWPDIATRFPAGEDGHLRNKRMELERQRMLAVREERAKASQSRWKRNANASSNDGRLQSSASASSSASESERGLARARAYGSETPKGQCDPARLTASWVRIMGHDPTGPLALLASMCESEVNRQSPPGDPHELFDALLDEFVAWRAGIPEDNKRPPKVPHKVVDHFARLLERLEKKRKAPRRADDKPDNPSKLGEDDE